MPGGPLPIVTASLRRADDAREQAIWKAELDKLVAEGDRLFHSDEIGTQRHRLRDVPPERVEHAPRDLPEVPDRS